MGKIQKHCPATTSDLIHADLFVHWIPMRNYWTPAKGSDMIHSLQLSIQSEMAPRYGSNLEWQLHSFIQLAALPYPEQCFFHKILDSSPTGYYVLELAAPVATLICLVVFSLATLEKLKIAYGYFPLHGWCIWLFQVVISVWRVTISILTKYEFRQQ
jgi:hypothetical protein